MNSPAPKSPDASSSERKIVIPSEKARHEQDIKETRAFLNANKDKNPQEFYDALTDDAQKRIVSAKAKLRKAEELQKSGVPDSYAFVKYAKDEVNLAESNLTKIESRKDFILQSKDLYVNFLETRLKTREGKIKIEEVLKKAEDKIKNKTETKKEDKKEKVAYKTNEKMNEKSTTLVNKDGVITKPEREKTKNPEDKEKLTRLDFKAAVVDTSDLMEAQARDDANFKMTETKEDREANWLKKWWTRTWKHNILHDYHHQKAVIEARKKILADKNLYANELGGLNKKGYEGAMDAVMQRFTSEYKNEMLLDEEKKNVKTIGENADINNLVKKFAQGGMDEMAFEVEKRKILIGINKDYENKDKLFADNLLKFAKEARDVCSHNNSINDLDIHVELTLGKAKDRLQTAEQMRGFDKIWNKIKDTGFGRRFLNEATVTLAGAIVYSVGKFAGLKALRSKIGQIFTFGGTAVAAGAVVAANESRRLEQERAQHARELAKGMKFEGDDLKRREQMEKYRYETVNSKEILENLRHAKDGLENNTLDATGVQLALKNLIDIEARLKLNAQRKIDLIKYSSPEQLERERTDLDLLRAQIKCLMRKTNPNLDTTLSREIENQMHHLLKNDKGGIEKINHRFKMMKIRRSAFKGLTATVLGGAIGYVGHEAGTHIMHWIWGEHSSVPHGTGVDALVGNKHFNMPDGTGIHPNPDGTYDIVHGDKTIHGLKFEFDENGNLKPESIAELAKNGVAVEPTLTGGHFTGSVSEYIKNHSHGTTRMHMHSDAWQHNDTPSLSDHNELRLRYGGINGTGLDANGDYVLDVSHMTDGGSWNGDSAVHALQKMHNGELKIALTGTRDTQHDPYEFVVGKDGLIHIPKDSEAAKLMLSRAINPKTGHIDFYRHTMNIILPTGEVAKDGGEYVKILAAAKGMGIENVDIDTSVHGYMLNIINKPDIDLPPFIYTGARRPLERGYYHKEGEEAPVDKNGVPIEKNKELEEGDKAKAIEAADEIDAIEAGPVISAIEGMPIQKRIEGPKDLSLEDARKAVDEAEKRLKEARASKKKGAIKRAKKALELAKENLKKLEGTNPDNIVVNYGGFDDSELLKKAPEGGAKNRVLEARKRLAEAQESARKGIPGSPDMVEEAKAELKKAEENLIRVEEAQEIIKSKKLRSKEFKHLRNDDMVFVAGKYNAFAKVEEIFTDSKEIRFKVDNDTDESFVTKITPNLVYLVSDIDKFKKDKTPGVVAPSAAPARPIVPVTPRTPAASIERSMSINEMRGLIKEFPKSIVQKEYADLKIGDEVYLADEDVVAKVTEKNDTSNEIVYKSNFSGIEIVEDAPIHDVYLVSDFKKLKDIKTKGETPAEISDKEAILPEINPVVTPERPMGVIEIESLINDFSKAIESKNYESLNIGDEVYLGGDIGQTVNVMEKLNDPDQIVFQSTFSNKEFVVDFPSDNVYLMNEVKKLKEYKDKNQVPPDIKKKKTSTKKSAKSAAPTTPSEARQFTDSEKSHKEYLVANPGVVAPVDKFSSLKPEQRVFITGPGQDKEAIVYAVNKTSITFRDAQDPENVDKMFTIKQSEIKKNKLGFYDVNEIEKNSNSVGPEKKSYNNTFELNQEFADYMKRFLSRISDIDEENIIEPKITIDGDKFILNFDLKKSDTETEKIEMSFSSSGKALVLNINTAGRKAFGMKFINSLNKNLILGENREIAEMTISKEGIKTVEKDIVK